MYLRRNLEFAIPELRAKADLCIKARALDAPTLRTRAPRHSPTITRRPNPCAVAVAGSKHHISIFPGGATCTRPKPTHPPDTMRSISTQFCFVFDPSFSARSADFGVDWGLTEIRQAGSEDSFFGFIALFVGSLGAGHISSPPSTTSLLRRIDRTIFIQVSLRVRRLSTPAAPNLAAAHTRPAAQPHMLSARAIHIYIPSPSPCTIPTALYAPRTRICVLIAARLKPSHNPPPAKMPRAAPPWRQTMTFGSMVDYVR